MKRKSIIYLLLVLLWCGVIFTFSDTPSKESNETSKKLIETSTMETLKRTNEMNLTKINIKNKKVRENIVNKLNVPVRKIAHATIYFVLAILFYLFLISMKVDRKKAILWTIAFCFLYSTTDEVHQTFVMERSGRLLDCLIDTLGASIGSMIIYKFMKKRQSISS